MDGAAASLGDRGVVEVAGPDARAFLQRLVTNDIEGLAPGHARYAALLTPQGKITADFLVVADAADPTRFLLDAPAALAADLAKRLTLYRLRAKLAVADRGADLGVLALGPGAAAPDGALAVYDDPRGAGLWRRAVVPRAALAGFETEAARRACDEARIRAGVPEGGLDFAYGETFPHDANLDRLHGVDFRKGCYVGQEVVSRVEHRGTARKRVVGLFFEGDPPPAGTVITVDGAPIGTVGSTVAGMGLGMVRLDRAADARQAGAPVLAGATPLRLEESGLA